MDDERFESLLVDELYGELDDETSAAVKRYAAAHPRAAEKLASLAAVRRAAAISPAAIPLDLEERILAAARRAQTVVPFRRRLSAAVSRAGGWAMRPQTAMAAVFLLMVGSSVLLVRVRSNRPLDTQAMKVTEQGAPAAAAPEEEERETVDPQAAALAHGALDKSGRAAAGPSGAATPPGPEAVALAEPSKSAPSLDLGLGALGDSNERSRKRDESASGAGRGWAPPPAEQGAAEPPPPARAAPQRYASAPAAPMAPMAPMATGNALPGAGAGVARAGDAPSSKGAARAPVSADFEGGLAAYRARNFNEATAIFDGLAAGGDVSAALWAARSVREASGCAAAVGRFDQLAAVAFSTVAGQDATYEAGHCYRSMGAPDTARARFARLLTVPSHMARAQAALDTLSARPASKVAKPAAPAKGDHLKQKAPF